MTSDDFKKILDDTLKPIQEGQEELKKGQKEFKKGYEELRKGQEEFRVELADVKNTIDTRILPPLTYIETTVKGYADMYKINDSNIRRVEKRLEPLEEDAGRDVPPELKLEPIPEPPPQP